MESKPRSAARIVGIDIARFVALAGMFATHILPTVDRDEFAVTFAQSVAGGRASALFAVLAGVSLALTSGRTTPVRGRAYVATAAGVAVRAVLIAVIGLALGRYDAGVAVILTYYGVLFLLGIPFLVLRARALFALAALWTVVVPVLAQLVRREMPERGFANPTFEMLGNPGALIGELTFAGHYPAVPWLAYLLVGLAIGRIDLVRWRSAALLAAAGATLVSAAVLVSDALLARPGVKVALAKPFGNSIEILDLFLASGFPGHTRTDSWWWLAVRAPHTATPFDLAQTIGSALLVIAACLVVGRLLPFTAVLFGAGAMTLTLYTAHVLLRVEVWDGDTSGTYLGHVVAALVVGALFTLVHRRGPLETVVGGLSRLVRRLVAGGGWRAGGGGPVDRGPVDRSPVDRSPADRAARTS